MWATLQAEAARPKIYNQDVGQIGKVLSHKHNAQPDESVEVVKETGKWPAFTGH